MHKLTVIWTRFSSEMQRPASCVDQERKARQGLDVKDIDHSHAKVFRVEAESGTKTDGAQFDELMQMIQRGEIAVLAVDDQGRFTKSDLAFSMILDLVYNGGRFISVGEGIDTDEPGWELKVKVLELHHSTSNRELARRVRRGQEGRVLDGNGSAGDYGYGYRADFADPNHTQWTGRGPKPKKVVVIYERAAAIVRMIFAWFIGGMSISAIARKLDALGIDKGHRSWRSGWRHQIVRRMLGNAKYIGQWSWGQTTTRRNSRGHKKQVPVDESLVTHKDRPDLRIIDDVTWQKAQKLLAELQKIYGKKPGRPSRKARVHHTEVYPSSLLSGLVFCGACNSRMTIEQSGARKYLGCPKHRRGACGVVARVRVDRAEKLIVDLIGSVLQCLPEWMDVAIDAMRHAINEAATKVPTTLAADEKRLAQVEKAIGNLVSAMEGGLEQSPALGGRLKDREREAEVFRERIDEQRKLLNQPVEMPDDAWIQEQLTNQVSLLAEDTPKAALVLRKLLGKVTAHQIKIRGKKRGYIQLRFRIDAFQALAGVLEDRVSVDMLSMIGPDAKPGSAQSPEFTINLGKPSRMDQWAPKIAELREQGVHWTEISRITGLNLGNAWAAWKRWTTAEDSDAA